MDNNNQISVIIPLYNKEGQIYETIMSVLRQTFPFFELIIVDDGSTDNSALIVKSISDSRIRYIYKQNGGVSSARNYGVKVATSDWIIFLDADDILFSCCLQTLSSARDKYFGKRKGIVTGNFVTIYNNKKIVFFSHKYEGIVRNNS